MRFKKQKRHRKIVRFFTTCFGFRKPFKVLCDGTFVHHLLVNRILPADTAVSNLLGGTVKLFTTRCVLAELKRLGHSHLQSLDAASNLMVANCEHEKAKPADACFVEVIGQNNPDHFFVATQDSDLRKKFQEIPGVPSIYGLRNALYLDPLSASQRQFVKSSEEKRSHMTDLERNLLKNKVKKVAMSEEDDSNDEKEDLGEHGSPFLAVEKTRNDRKRVEAVKDRVQFKRKRAKGPNPLSCKRKKTPAKSQAAPDKKSEVGIVDSQKSSRKRKRPRKHKQGVESEN